MGVYDLPAVITYITNIKNDEILYVGHSMGSAMFYIMALERPDIAAKVKAMFGLAPAAFMDHVRILLSPLTPYVNKISSLLNNLEIYELFSKSSQTQLIKNLACDLDLTENNICVQLMFAVTGESTAHLDFNLSPLILNHSPGSASTKTFVHYFQIGKAKKFQYFDYGRSGNLKLYNSTNPPIYDLTKIQVPIGIIYSEGDFVVNQIDVKRAYNLLPNKIFIYKIPSPNFSHIAFMYASDASELFHSKLLSVMKNYA